MKLQLVCVAAAVALTQSVLAASHEVPSLRGTIDDAEDAAPVSNSAFFLGMTRPRPNLTARAMKLSSPRIAPIKPANAEDSGVRELRELCGSCNPPSKSSKSSKSAKSRRKLCDLRCRDLMAGV